MIQKTTAVAVTVALALSTTLSACASAPEDISASYVAPVAYQGLDCGQLKDELQGVTTEVQRVSGQQAKKAKNDKWATGVGIVLFWPALFFLATGDKAEKLANLKGQYNALVTTAKAKKCDYAAELRPA